MLEIYAVDINSIEVLTYKSLAMFLLKDNDKIYLLRGTTVSPYMSKQLYRDIREAIELNFTLSEIVDLYDNSKSLELLGTTFEIYKKFATDVWNWHAWELNKNFYPRFMTYVKSGRWVYEIL